MRQKFDINNIIKYYGLDIQYLASLLFPNVKYPKQAFDRILKGEANLDTDQVERLANYIGVFVSDLYSVSNEWKGNAEDKCLTFMKGEYKVKLGYNGVYISIYKDNELIYQRISDLQSMEIPEFINYIDNLIKIFENGNN